MCSRSPRSTSGAGRCRRCCANSSWIRSARRTTWRWYGYDNSWIVLDGAAGAVGERRRALGRRHVHQRPRHGTLRLLTLRSGKWGERQILSEEWIRKATTPTPAQPTYGFMNYFLNTGRRALPSAPEPAFWHLGAGSNIIYVDPVNDLVVVARWISGTHALDAVIKRLLQGARAPV